MLSYICEASHRDFLLLLDVFVSGGYLVSASRHQTGDVVAGQWEDRASGLISIPDRNGSDPNVHRGAFDAGGGWIGDL